jgi:hypothetical protein
MLARLEHGRLSRGGRESGGCGGLLCGAPDGPRRPLKSREIALSFTKSSNPGFCDLFCSNVPSVPNLAVTTVVLLGGEKRENVLFSIQEPGIIIKSCIALLPIEGRKKRKKEIRTT